MAKSGSIAVIMAVAMLAAGDHRPLDVIIGIPPFMFMVYVILSSRSSRRARKAEEKEEIDAAMYLTAQCEKLLSRTYHERGALGAHDRQAVFGHMLSAIRLLRSQYGRYLDRRAVWAAQQAESIIIDAGMPGEEEGDEGRAELLGRQIAAIRNGLLDIDDARLRAVREAL